MLLVRLVTCFFRFVPSRHFRIDGQMPTPRQPQTILEMHNVLHSCTHDRALQRDRSSSCQAKAHLLDSRNNFSATLRSRTSRRSAAVSCSSSSPKSSDSDTSLRFLSSWAFTPGSPSQELIAAPDDAMAADRNMKATKTDTHSRASVARMISGFGGAGIFHE